MIIYRKFDLEALVLKHIHKVIMRYDLVKILIICLTFFNSKCHELQRIFQCMEGFTCIPLSECSEIESLVEDDNILDYAKTLVCGYFHEPYVCCNRDCYTPNGSYGKTMLLGNCIFLETNKYSDDPKKLGFLAESHLNHSHVCCNKNENEYKFVPSAPTNFSTSPHEPKPLNLTCRTPNGNIGQCTNIDQCEAYHIAETGTDEEFRFINDSFCGYWTKPMICCSDDVGYDEKFAHNVPKLETCGFWNDTSTFPSWLAVIDSKNKLSFCLGALINAEFVLTTTQCAEDLENLYVKFGSCIEEESENCKFWVKEAKVFPIHNYLMTEDTGIVLLRLSRPTSIQNGIYPVCLPIEELGQPANIDVVGLRKTYFRKLKTTIFSHYTIENDECHKIMETFLENIICIRNEYFCKIRKNLLENLILKMEKGKWYIQGLFPTETCYGASSDYTIGIYVYKFIKWIKSNMG